jgi:hypothetical protein
MQGHLRVYKDFQEIMELHSISDRIPRKFDFEADFNNISADQEELVFYTDGSRKEGLVGMGIYGPSLRHYEALGTRLERFCMGKF